jgi:hypothetical protein
MVARESNTKAMNHVERFRALMNFQPIDRLPRWEWAMWWDLTIDRWHTEGLPANLTGVFEIAEYFGLDPYQQFWFSTTAPTIEAVQHHIEGTVANMDDYLRVLPSLYPNHSAAIDSMRPWATRQARGEAVVWITLEGFFWFPRTLLGFETMMLAYNDQPELLHRINSDLLAFNLGLIEKIGKACVPTFMTIAEDMSYNHGPMISRRICDQFMTPYYLRLLERVKEMNILTIMDSDGDVTKLVPWLQSVGVEGVLPLERQARPPCARNSNGSCPSCAPADSSPASTTRPRPRFQSTNTASTCVFSTNTPRSNRPPSVPSSAGLQTGCSAGLKTGTCKSA